MKLELAKYVSEKILEVHQLKGNKGIRYVLSELDSLTPELHQEIIHYTLNKYFSIYSDNFLIFYSPFYEKLSLNNWESIILKLKDNPLSLYYIVSFAYKYLKVDFVNYFQESEPNLSSTLVDIFKDRKGGFIYYEEDIRLLKAYDVKLNYLISIGNALIKEGALKAKPLPVKTIKIKMEFPKKNRKK